MSETNNIKPVKLVMVEINYLRTIGSGLVKSVKKMEQSYQDDLYSICILSTQAIELLLKSVIASEICLKYNSDSEDGIKCLIEKTFKSYGHNLDRLFLSNEIEKVKNLLNIKSVTRFNETGFVDDYRILLNDNSELCFKTLEGSRYGSFASNKNIAIFPDYRIFSFLEKLNIECFNHINEVYNSLDEIKETENAKIVS